MKKYLIVVACVLAIVGCKQKQGQTTGDVAETDSVQTEETADGKMFTPAEISSRWTNKSIHVADGGELPDIMALLKAFHVVWPTEPVNLLLGMAADKVTRQLNPDTGGGMEIDNKNGYATVQPGDTDEDRLFATVWKRSNGHRLFGIWLYTPSADNRSKAEGEALCFCDYDPKTETMKPEKDNAVIQFQPSKDCYVQYKFPDMGRDMLVGETDKDYNTKWHVFAYDGINFKEETAYTDDKLRQSVVGLWKSTDKKLPLTFRVTLDEEDWPQITDCGIYGVEDWEVVASVYEGYFYVIEQNPKGYLDDDEEQSKFKPSLTCAFLLTKDGRLTGGYHMMLPSGKEHNGIMTMEKQSQLNDYAE